MSTPRINYSAPLTRSLVARGILSSFPFVLVDVGASGGIEQCWRVFQPDLKAFGFDPLVKEVERFMAEKQVLGLLVESQLHGIAHAHSNVFSNIDRLMREQGFSLFDFEIYRYTRATLPGHFVYDIPAQTHEGQVVWGDALYLRDVTAPGYEGRWGH